MATERNREGLPGQPDGASGGPAASGSESRLWPTRQQTIQALKVAGDMIYDGFVACRAAQSQPPLIPSLEKLFSAAQEHSSMDSLTEDQRLTFDARFYKVYTDLQRRARIQAHWQEHNTAKILGKVFNRRLSEGKKINADEVEIDWGILSMLTSLDDESYDIIRLTTDPQGENSRADLRTFEDPILGYIGMVRKGAEQWKSVQHEDAHAFEMSAGGDIILRGLTDFLRLNQLKRLINGKDNPDDAIVALQAAAAVKIQAVRRVNYEFAPSLWAHESVSSATVEEVWQPLRIITVVLDVYAGSNELDLDRLLFALHSRMMGAQIDQYLEIHRLLAEETAKQFSGEDTWEKAAARASTLPPNASLRLKKAVLLDDPTSFVDPPLRWAEALAGAMVSFARFKAEPDLAWHDRLKQRTITPEKLTAFRESLINLLQNRKLLSDATARYGGRLDDQFEILKDVLAEDMLYLVPPGDREEQKRLLTEAVRPV